MAKNDTREKIIKTSLELFAQFGYTSTSTKQIAQEACVNEVTIFRHFGTKDKLFQEVMREYVESLEFSQKIGVYEKLPVDECVKKIGREYLDYCFDNFEIYKIQMKMQDNIEQMNKLQLSKTYVSGCTTYFNHLKEKGLIKNDPEKLANIFILSVLGFFNFYVLADNMEHDYIYELLDLHMESFIKGNIYI
ncbi:MAG: TetR/AcrR family transcriptional regulator [Lachnospirales bacterium]